MSFYERFLSLLHSEYPVATSALDVGARLTPNLLCPQIVQLPRNIKDQAEQIAKSFFNLRQNPQWRLPLESKNPPVPNPGNFSALMSYDFHIDTNGQLRLIEINTNASMSLLVELMHKLQGVANPFSEDFKSEIISTFFDEAKLALNGRTITHAAVVDENPTEQRMYVEFEMYRELFERAGLKAYILDPSDLKFEGGELKNGDQKIDLIYNRHTDFYLQQPETTPMRLATEAHAACLSPHPHEYRLLADKGRLKELSKPETLAAIDLSAHDKQIISQTLIRTLEVSSFTSPDELWADRKRWFFKPSQSFGGKAVYRGSSMSRSTFNQQVLTGNYLAQENIPAPVVTIPLEAGGEEEFKYDLRFFAYKDRIQLACARLYKGQTTNSQTPGGGIAVVDWI